MLLSSRSGASLTRPRIPSRRAPRWAAYSGTLGSSRRSSRSSLKMHPPCALIAVYYRCGRVSSCASLVCHFHWGIVPTCRTRFCSGSAPQAPDIQCACDPRVAFIIRWRRVVSSAQRGDLLVQPAARFSYQRASLIPGYEGTVRGKRLEDLAFGGPVASRRSERRDELWIL